MNVRRRILCLFALVIAFALAGCGGGSPTPSSSPPPGPGAVKEADKKAKNSPQQKKGLEMPPPLD
jgi:ABC-type glycerol-3-phosphate transport system substrate-binding protein